MTIKSYYVNYVMEGGIFGDNRSPAETKGREIFGYMKWHQIIEDFECPDEEFTLGSLFIGEPKARMQFFLTFIDALRQIILCHGKLALCMTGCLAAPLASTYSILVASSPLQTVTTKTVFKHCQMSPG